MDNIKEHIFDRFSKYEFEKIALKKKKAKSNKGSIVGEYAINDPNHSTLTIFIGLDVVKENYTLNATIKGYFEFKDEIDDETVKTFLKTSGISILFPFLRSAVSDITRIAGYTPVLLPIINPSQIRFESENN